MNKNNKNNNKKDNKINNKMIILSNILILNDRLNE